MDIHKKDKDAASLDGNASKSLETSPPPPPVILEADEFGLPIRHYTAAAQPHDPSVRQSNATDDADATSKTDKKTYEMRDEAPASQPAPKPRDNREIDSDSDEATFEDAPTALPPASGASSPSKPELEPQTPSAKPMIPVADGELPTPLTQAVPSEGASGLETSQFRQESAEEAAQESIAKTPRAEQGQQLPSPSKVGDIKPSVAHSRDTSIASAANGLGVSEFSHQQLSVQHEAKVEDVDGGWQTMPAFARYDMYDDDNRLIAREHNGEEEMEKYGYGGLGGAGKGYTRVLMDDDAQSATSMDENTQYLFKEANSTTMAGEDDDARDAVSQMQATKDLLTEGQRIAYVGVVRLEIAKLVKEAEDVEATKKIKKDISVAAEATKMWGQKMMIRLYSHMDISEAEQVMIEQLADHGVMPGDLTPALHANSRVQNPLAKEKEAVDKDSKEGQSPSQSIVEEEEEEEVAAELPPPYESAESSVVPDVQTPSQLPTTEKIDIDLRCTVLCDLFLILIADSIYDARSRVLLERVGASLDISWIDICKFEKRVTDALEMQQAAEKENWNEDEHMESRRKRALKRRYVMMGLATVGGGLVIGLSAGLLAPVIGAGLAAGFTTIGVTGTSGFLAGAGGAAIITSSAAASGSIIGVRAANRRTGAVKTFEYRPLHNNKRVNLIVTVSGWLTGKVDDVRLPFSTVDPIMGDIYSVLWEPEMLRSMGDTINILATEALTQGLQQILGSTILVSLMAALQLPIVLTKLSYLIDNPWAVSLDRAMSAGLILADSLLERSLGTRPITLVGYSLGARVIFSCLQELAKKGAYGVIQNVYVFGSPVVVKKEEFLRARTVVSGRFVNGYNRNDWILGYLFRLTNGGIRRIAGLAPMDECPWIENMDVTELVPGHMEYRKAMPTLLMKCGWMVESEEFTEIEDPDPDNHKERQRELINEIEEARKGLEREGKAKKSGKFGIFSRRKKTERQEWEVYEDSASKEAGKVEDKEGNNHGVLFDIDAIRAELAKEAQNGAPEEELQVKEIQSTLPPMKLDFSPISAPSSSLVVDGRNPLRETKSADVLSIHGSHEARTSQDPPAYVPGPAEEEIQMTFDTSFDDEPMRDDGLTRPTIKTSNTVPNMTLTDPWADAEDEDFGKEKEISMTFA
ncbi:putative membrane protein [Tolypocladium ophioglossoides CBS 100239]|uniref:Putative membrane protein n=1 Tax=Tolypocladium ophioglossoides (strain CBS 100239) TaxID=1163406 RepID=A0A0L0NMP3_TOLOC|nr:putative membrane protein [Tolypocladium ophioglossoides CBS 100239]